MHQVWGDDLEETSGEGFDQVQFISLFTGEDGSFFIMFHQLLHTGKAPLTNAVDSILQLHLKMFVLPHSFQRDGEITRLNERKRNEY